MEDDSMNQWSMPLFIDGKFQNPWTNWKPPNFSWNLLKFIFGTNDESNVPKPAELDRTLPVIKPEMSHFKSSPSNGIRHMWIGHASSLVQFDGITFLTDPVFSCRCSVSQWFGPKRYRPPPCAVKDLPNIDCVLISHNHYDHLDFPSVKALNMRFGDNLRWYVPIGLKQWMNESGCNNVMELTWWQEFKHSEESEIKVVSTPCQHWSKRGVMDDNKVLWTSWCVIGPKHRFYFAGDTGYCPVFKEIGKKYGPFNLSTIPIGAYHPRWFLSPQHVCPEEAIDIHEDIKSHSSIGIHWGTFQLSYEFYLEPREKIKDELQRRGLDPSCFITVKHGEVTITGGSKEEAKL